MRRTVSKNLKKIPKGYKKLQQVRRKLFKEFQPECVITDFEPMTARLARRYDLPLITIDNQHHIRYMRFECPKRLKGERRLTRNIIRAMSITNAERAIRKLKPKTGNASAVAGHPRRGLAEAAPRSP